MRVRLAVPLHASTLFASGLLACVLVACGLTVEGALPAAGVDESAGGDGAGPPGPVVSCTTASDCPAAPNDCVVATCDGATCASTNVKAGTTCTSDGGRACDGNGKCAACAVPDDCPRWLTACTQNACTANACGAVSAPASTGCTDNGGRLCDGAGTCVACVAPADCPAQTTVCKTNTCDGHACGTLDAPKGTACTENGGVVCSGTGDCVPMHCTDAVMDADETDVDCGGSCGATCKDTGPQQKCLVAGDCVSGVCKAGALLCQPPACNDGVQNGNETDVDCGGSGFGGKPACPTCADKKHCAKNGDCAHNSCFGSGPGTCVSCVDDAKDGNETDSDCGGVSCDLQGKTCATGKACLTAFDCASLTCTGGTCELRPDGDTCFTSTQCLHGACLPVSGGGRICCSSPCMDQGAMGCGTNGQCAPGGAACADYASGTKCGTAACTGNTLASKTCNGTGTCVVGASSTCGGHLDCNAGGTLCLTGCGANNSGGDASCADGYWCDGSGGKGACQPPQPAGSSCSRSAQCQNSCNTGQNKCK